MDRKERKERKGDVNVIIVVGVANGPLGYIDISQQRRIHTAVIKGF